MYGRRRRFLEQVLSIFERPTSGGRVPATTHSANPETSRHSRGKTTSLQGEQEFECQDMPDLLTAGAAAGLVCPWLPISNTRVERVRN
jgi:hypothetical protein